MRLLRIIPGLDPRSGGPIEGARQIDRQLIDRGHQVEVVCLDNYEKLHSSYPAQVHCLGPAKFRYAYSGRLVPWLRENRSRFDAVIVNGLWQYHTFAAWCAFARTDTPYFVFTHGMLDPWFKHTYPLKHLKKWMYWPWADYRVLRDAKAVLFTSDEERRLARESFWLYRCNEAVTAYGTSAPPENERGRLSEEFLGRYPELRGKALLLYMSRIHEKKGCDLLIEAFAAIANRDSRAHLVMAGPDQTGWVSALRDLASSLGVSDRITWTGMLQGDVKWGALYAADAFCLPSHQENFGIAVAEALACSVPVLISNKVNIWREVAADGAGLIDEDTSEGTLRVLAQWVAMRPEEKDAMRVAANRCFQRRFTIEAVVDDLLRIVSSNLPTSRHGDEQ